jgi:hypothetical protein
MHPEQSVKNLRGKLPIVGNKCRDCIAAPSDANRPFGAMLATEMERMKTRKNMQFKKKHQNIQCKVTKQTFKNKDHLCLIFE